MYSGTTLTKFSGRVIGTHQKIDKVAHKQIVKLLTDKNAFPNIRSILHFEGKNGPDGIKRKSPAHDEPWHFFDPFNNSDNQLLELITNHYDRLVIEIKAQNTERAAFEAAWLAHAIVDGLTPAHHYPYEQKLVELSGGAHIHTRTSLKKKVVMPGNNKRQVFKNNWLAWGPRGVRTAHGLFEMGVAALIAPLTFSELTSVPKDLHNLQKLGIADWYRNTAREVAILGMYEAYCNKGWTPKLAWQVRHRLGPILVMSVALVWQSALVDAGVIEK